MSGLGFPEGRWGCSPPQEYSIFFAQFLCYFFCSDLPSFRLILHFTSHWFLELSSICNLLHTKNNSNNDNNKMIRTETFPLASHDQFRCTWCVCVWPQGYFIWLDFLWPIRKLPESAQPHVIDSTPTLFPLPAHSPCYWILVHSCKHWWINRPLPRVLWVYSGPCGPSCNQS